MANLLLNILISEAILTYSQQTNMVTSWNYGDPQGMFTFSVFIHAPTLILMHQSTI